MRNHIKMRKLLTASLLGTACWAGAARVSNSQAFAGGSAIVYRDMGNKDDFDAKQDIHFDAEGSFGGDGWPKLWSLKVNGQEGAFFENSQNFWWVFAPLADAKDVISSRCIMMHQYGRFRVESASLPADGDLFLTIRAKDDLIGPAPVFVWSGGTSWTQVGEFGGNFDHRWKTVQFTVPASKRAIDKETYVFKVGVDAYSPSMKGELPIDRIALGSTRDHDQFPPDQDGFWPQGPVDKFKDLGKTMELVPGQRPYFMFGVWDANHWISDGGGRDHPGHGPKDTWQQFENAGLNSYILHGWNQNWESFWKANPGDPISKWAYPAVRCELGMKENLLQAKGHNLKVIPNFLGDTRQYWIRTRYHGEQQTLDGLGKIMAEHDQDPTVLAWYPVDEWDHEDGNFAKPILFSHLLYNQTHISSPNKPTLMLLMGFKGIDAWRVAHRSADADLFGIDCYISDFRKKGGTDAALKAQGDRLDIMRAEFGRDVPYFLAPELQHQKKGHLKPEEIVAQGYQALIHGARGILYFAFFYPPPDDVWVGPTQMSHELFDPKEGLAKLVLPASSLLEVNGDANIAKCSNKAIQWAVFADSRGRRTLITLNPTEEAVKNAQFNVSGLGDGKIGTHFESGRTISAKGDVFSDDFEPLARHVYDLN